MEREHARRATQKTPQGGVIEGQPDQGVNSAGPEEKVDLREAVSGDYRFQGTLVRAFYIFGRTWFVASEVCAALEIANPRDAIKLIDPEDRGVGIVYTPGGEQSVNLVNEKRALLPDLQVTQAAGEGVPEMGHRRSSSADSPNRRLRGKRSDWSGRVHRPAALRRRNAIRGAEHSRQAATHSAHGRRGTAGREHFPRCSGPLLGPQRDRGVVEQGALRRPKHAGAG
jgi:hypothetical protein